MSTLSGQRRLPFHCSDYCTMRIPSPFSYTFTPRKKQRPDKSHFIRTQENRQIKITLQKVQREIKLYPCKFMQPYSLLIGLILFSYAKIIMRQSRSAGLCIERGRKKEIRVVRLYSKRNHTRQIFVESRTLKISSRFHNLTCLWVIACSLHVRSICCYCFSSFENICGNYVGSN